MVEKVPVIPASVAKKQKAAAAYSAKRAAAHAEAKKANKLQRRVIFNKAKAYAREYSAAERSVVRSKRLARSTGSFFVPAEAKLAFVVRIRGINGINPVSKKILQLLRLRQINNGVFVKLNKSSINMLRK
eukprot:Ihof_evm2s122 gene=Ihof_evmTU2s122